MAKTNHTHNVRGPLICSFFTIFLLLAGATALIVWLVYHPSHPRFKVVAAAIYTINTTSPQTISTTMQFTLVLHNPSKRTTIFYDRLSASVSYRNQAVTLPMSLHELFQEPKSTVALSPMVGGECVPVSQEVLDGLLVDKEYGVLGLRVELMGRLRWKAGPFWSKHYRMYVKCDVLVGVKEGVDGQAPLLGSPDCALDV
ncbi:NDR1/HIN1-like protein 12 isoform X1 [Cinnamomum micranthum f. kanehirae]|uniref:NDR1/HIN1-like protein 12 isoform X1 n=1 Tax=Cinnamomum micranthum f. kanehirae TaxID=337451 RepID=A0A443P6Y2_9MAGN|nr:NDR1/HIN1-like protein 12 isoform X1 [Cinnamomum micranthum f. kanehirae]